MEEKQLEMLAERMDPIQMRAQMDKIQDLKDEVFLKEMSKEECDKFKIRMGMLDRILNSQALFNKVPLFVNRR